MDDYSFASEVALHQLSVELDVTLDGILCDPELAALLDKIAGQFSHGDHSSFEYRWAALTLRKRAKSAKRLADECKDWLTKDLPSARSLARRTRGAWGLPVESDVRSRDGGSRSSSTP